MKKQYQIDKQRAVQQFRRLAAQDDQAIQLVIPLKEVLDLVQRGLMSLALRTFTQVAEEVMDYEVMALVGPKNQANPERERVRWGRERGYCVVVVSEGVRDADGIKYGVAVPRQLPRMQIPDEPGRSWRVVYSHSAVLP